MEEPLPRRFAPEIFRKRMLIEGYRRSRMTSASFWRRPAQSVWTSGPYRCGWWTTSPYETGTWAYTFQPKGQAERRIGGRYVTLWRRQPDGGWKIWADMGVPGT